MSKSLRLIILVLLLTRFPIISEAQRTTGGTPRSFTTDKTKRKLGEPVIPESTVPVIDNNAELEKAKKISPNIYGLINAVNVDIIKQGFKEALSDGGTLWRYKISSSTAYSMEVVFSRFNLPNKAQLFIYNEDHSMILGALSSLNNSAEKILATQPIFGSTIIIEYYEPADVEFRGEIVVGEVVHDFANVLQFVKGQGPFVPVGDYRDVSCIKNISCPEAQPYADQAKAVALILYKMPSGKYVGHATGTLINNSSNDGQPYFLTAYHNIDGDNANCSDGTDLCFDFSKWVVLFNHYDPDCNGTGQGVSNSIINSVTGAKRLSGDRDKDYLLMRLNSTPENVCYAGWSRNSSPQPPFVDIHHPLGDVKKISFYNRQLGSTIPNFWLVDNWNSGYTAQGSSGSSLLDNNKRIVGVLYSGEGGDYCEADPNFNPRTDPVPDPNNPPITASSLFGRFSISFDDGHFGVYLGNVQQTDTYCPVVEVKSCPGNNQRQMRTGAQMRTLSTCMEVNFSADKTEALVNELVTFTNLSSGGVGNVTYAWNFGADAVPATSTAEGPPAVYYSTTGNKWVTLTVCDTEGCITEQKSAYIEIQNSSSSVLVNFSSDKKFADINEVIKFSSAVSGNSGSVTYLWNFGTDATASSLVTANPTVTFSSAGVKTVSLQVTDKAGAVTEIKNAFIVVSAPNIFPLRVDFAGCPPVALTTGSNVVFMDASFGGSTYPLTSYLWDFGDGSTSTSMNTNHIYNSVGNYTVSLKVCDGSNCITKTNAGCVNISGLQSNSASAYLINGSNATTNAPITVGRNRPVVFSNAANKVTGADYSWEFDVNGMSVVKFASPSVANVYGPHTVFYTQPGTYSTSLFVRNYNPMPLTLWKKDVKIDAIKVVDGMGAGDCKGLLGNVSISTTCWNKGVYPEFKVDVNSYTCPYVIRIKSAKTGQFLTNNKIDFNNGTNLPVFPYTDTYTISINHFDGVSYTLLDSKSMTVTLYNPGANAGPDIAICPGNEIQLGSASKPNTTYSWSCNPSTGVTYLSDATIANPKFNTVISGTYNYVVYARDLTSGCINSDDAKITIQPVTVGNKTYSTCMGGIETLNLPVAGGAGGFTGVWTPSTYLTNANILNPNVQAPLTGTTLLYNLTVTDSKGCKGSGTALVNVSAIAPNGLVTVVGFKEVKLTWIDNSTNETAFVVERSTSPTSGFVTIATLPENTTTYTDKTAALGVTYYYRVYPKNATTTNLGYSNTSSAYTNLPIAWDKTYGGSDAETDVKIFATSDGGYIVGSTTKSEAGADVSQNHSNGVWTTARVGGLTVMWIVKLDACGNKVWDKKFNILEETYTFVDFVEVSDGYVLLSGRWYPNSGAASTNRLSGYDTYVTKISKSGVQIWGKKYGNVNTEMPSSIVASGDGGFIIASTSDSPAGGDKSQGYVSGDSWNYNFPNSDLWILKIDGNGTKVWDKTIGNANVSEYTPAICASGDGGYLIASHNSPNRTSSGYPPGPLRLTKIDASGNKSWSTTYFPVSGSYSGVSPTIIKTSDGNYIMGTMNNLNYILIKVDPNGTVLWKKEFIGPNDDYLASIKEFSNGDLLIGGSSNSSVGGNKSEASYGGTDFWILRTDQAGNIIWNKTVRGTSGETLGNLAVLSDGSFLMCGSSSSPAGGDKSEAGRGGTDIWLLKVGTGQSAGSVSLGSINPTAYFPSAAVAIPFTASCTKPGETFTAQFSDLNGSFASPVNIGTFSGGTAGTINGTIPSDAIPGTGYKIRVVSSITNSISSDNGQYITVKSSQITTGTISPTAYMPGGTLSVPYSISGTFKSGNVFTAQLSDANGYFINPVNIGTLTSTAAGTINATIPANTPVGRGYRIRVVGSNPLVNGSDNGVNISVGRLFTETISDKVYYPGDAILVPYTALGTFNSGNVFTAILSDASGSFTTSTTTIGTLVSTSSGSISAVIPVTAIPGASYRIKVTSDKPVIDGTINTKDIVISTPIVTLGTLAAKRILSGATFAVPYKVNGIFNTGNQFTVQLSDEKGSFLRPVSIGSLTSSASGSINVQIPLSVPMGDGYRVRIVSSSPSTVSNDNGFDISIYGILTNTVSPASYYAGKTIAVSYQTNLQFVSGNIFNVELSDVNGSFANPVIIGSSSQTGSINAVLPIDLLPGTMYRVRVVSTQPAVNGLSNPENITIRSGSMAVYLDQDPNLCSGSQVVVYYGAEGYFSSANVFMALLSDASGSFDNPAILGMENASGTGLSGIYTTIPKYLMPGAGYKLRVQSSSPQMYAEIPVAIIKAPRAINSFSSTNINLGETVDIKSGKVLNFDGVDDYVSVPGFSQPANGGAITVEFWLKVNKDDLRNSSVFSVGTDQYNRLQAHAPWGDGTLTFDYGSLTNPASRITVDFNPYLDKWTHVALVSSGKANTFRAIYLNGNLVKSENSSDGNGLAMSGLKLGTFVNNTLFMKGMMDEFRIWNVMRSQADIQNGMTKLIDENTSGLLLYLQMHEGTGTVVKDRSGKNLNGTVNGPVWAAPYTNMSYNWVPATIPATGPNVTASPDYSTTYLLTVQDLTTGCYGDYSTQVYVKDGIYTYSVGPNVRYTLEEMQVNFKTNIYYPSATVFNVELSDANGSFASPRIIGSGQGRSISVKIPEDAAPGTGYRVRVVSVTNPVVIGFPNPENISIQKSLVTLGLAANSNICAGYFSIPVTMTGGFNSNNVFSALLSDASGNFANPTVLNSIAWAQAGSMQMTAELPREIPLTGNYKLRVQSSSPYSFDEKYVKLNLPARAIGSVSSNNICSGEQIQLSAAKVVTFGGSHAKVSGFSAPVNGPVTVEFWIFASATDLRTGQIFAVGSDQNNQLQASCTNGTMAFDYGSSSNPASRITVNLNPYFDKWTHVALVSSGKANTFKAIYLNGRLVASANISDGNATAVSGLKIGSFPSNVSLNIDEFKIWNIMRSEAQIKDGINKSLLANTPGLMLYLPMHEGTGNIINDKSGNGLNGTISIPSWSNPYSGLTYTWNPATTPQTGTSVTATPTTNTTYTLTTTSPISGCQYSYFFPVIVKPAPCTQGLMAQYADIEEPSSVSGVDYANSQGIEMFPNPSDGMFSITMKESDQVTIQIIDALGNKVKEVKGTGDKFNIEAMELSAGFYSVNIIVNGKMISKKMTIIK